MPLLVRWLIAGGAPGIGDALSDQDGTAAAPGHGHGAHRITNYQGPQRSGHGMALGPMALRPARGRAAGKTAADAGASRLIRPGACGRRTAQGRQQGAGRDRDAGPQPAPPRPRLRPAPPPTGVLAARAGLLRSWPAVPAAGPASRVARARPAAGAGRSSGWRCPSNLLGRVLRDAAARHPWPRRANRRWLRRVSRAWPRRSGRPFAEAGRKSAASPMQPGFHRAHRHAESDGSALVVETRPGAQLDNLAFVPGEPVHGPAYLGHLTLPSTAAATASA